MSDKVIAIIIIGYLASCVAFYFINMFVAGKIIIDLTLVRKDGDHWGRALSPDAPPKQIKMYATGAEWHEANKAFKKDVHIVNEGLNLYGEYYDFGSDKAVMILSGRTESLIYGYYFAIPYAKAGFNVLVFDPRGHGLSDGKYNTVGFDESRDAVAWASFLEKEQGVKSIVFHGICIGAATGMFAITSENCPKAVKAMVTEGMFANFSYSMINHFKEKRCNFPLLMTYTDYWFKRYTGHSMKVGPIDRIGSLNKPLLMLQSKKDAYSTHQKASLLFERCGSDDKTLVFFDEGDHSMLRITDTEKYDSAIDEFVTRVFGK